jgi:hypothetical protein
VRSYTMRVADELLRRVKGHAHQGIVVDLILPKDPSFRACFAEGGWTFQYNVRCLGKDWFDEVERDELNHLIIHELAHHWSGDHLSEDYHDALCDLGAALGELALDRPDLLELR